jgi:hypothetical protein
MADTPSVRDQVQRHWDALMANDDEAAHSVYHEDAVLEFPQSGERFEGLATFREWRSQYPAAVEYEIQRISVDGNLAVVAVTIGYDGGERQFGVQVLDFRDGKIDRERIYVMEGWEAPEWRRPWRAVSDGHS